METQKFKRLRSVRIVPVLRQETSQYLVQELEHTVQIDDEVIRTAPYRFGEEFSILGMSQTQSLLDTLAMDVTDGISHKALLESIYVKIGDQYVKVEVNEPLANTPRNNYREIGLVSFAFSANIGRYTRDINDKTLSVFDPYTAAGIVITLEAKIAGRMNLELANTYFIASSIEAQITFPDAPSLRDEEIRVRIRKDLFDKITEGVKLVGYDLDADRLNHLTAPKYVSQEELQDAAASVLVAGYQTPPADAPA